MTTTDGSTAGSTGIEAAPPTEPIGPVPRPRPRSRHRAPDLAPASGAGTERAEKPRRADGDGRLLGVDAARGVALLGMMAVHALYATDATGDPSLSQEIAGGRAAALFAVLAGVGIAFTTGRRRVPLTRALPAAASLLARAAAIALIGLALGFADASIAAVILPYYAVLFVAAVPLVLLGRRTLLVLGLAAAVWIPFWSQDLRAGLPAPSLENPTFAQAFTDPLGLLSELGVTGYYPALSWTAYLAVGIAIGRMTLGRSSTAVGLLTGGAALAVASKLASQALLSLGGLDRIRADAVAQGMSASRFDDILALGPEGTVPTTSRWWLAIASQHSSTPPDMLHTIGTSAAVIGLMLLLGHVANPVLSPLIALVRRPLAAAGSMTLTFYAAHIVFMNSPFDVYSAGVGYALQVTAVLVIGLIWQSTAGRGPLERVVARVAKAAGRPFGNSGTARRVEDPGLSSTKEVPR